MSLKITPLGDHVLVEPTEENEVKKGGIIIPDTAKEKSTEGGVRAVGPGKRDDDGKVTPIEVKEGDSVLTTKNAATEEKLDGKEYKRLRRDDVHGEVN